MLQALFPPVEVLALLAVIGLVTIAAAARHAGGTPAEAATRGALLAGAFYAVALGSLGSVLALSSLLDALEPTAPDGAITRALVSASVRRLLQVDAAGPLLAPAVGALVAGLAVLPAIRTASRTGGASASSVRPSGVVLVLTGLAILPMRLVLAEAASPLLGSTGIGLLPALGGLVLVALGLAWLRRPGTGASLRSATPAGAGATRTVDAIAATLFAWGSSGGPGSLVASLIVIPQLDLLSDQALGVASPRPPWPGVTEAFGQLALVQDLVVLLLIGGAASAWWLAVSAAGWVVRWRGAPA
jgi:hypothetical protein